MPRCETDRECAVGLGRADATGGVVAKHAVARHLQVEHDGSALGRLQVGHEPQAQLGAPVAAVAAREGLRRVKGC